MSIMEDQIFPWLLSLLYLPPIFLAFVSAPLLPVDMFSEYTYAYFYSPDAAVFVSSHSISAAHRSGVCRAFGAVKFQRTALFSLLLIPDSHLHFPSSCLFPHPTGCEGEGQVAILEDFILVNNTLHLLTRSKFNFHSIFWNGKCFCGGVLKLLLYILYSRAQKSEMKITLEIIGLTDLETFKNTSHDLKCREKKKRFRTLFIEKHIKRSKLEALTMCKSSDFLELCSLTSIDKPLHAAK